MKHYKIKLTDKFSGVRLVTVTAKTAGSSMTSILLRNISISRSYQDLATRTGTRGGRKRYARTSRQNTSGSIFTAKSETAGSSDKPA